MIAGTVEIGVMRRDVPLPPVALVLLAVHVVLDPLKGILEQGMAGKRPLICQLHLRFPRLPRKLCPPVAQGLDREPSGKSRDHERKLQGPSPIHPLAMKARGRLARKRGRQLRRHGASQPTPAPSPPDGGPREPLDGIIPIPVRPPGFIPERIPGSLRGVTAPDILNRDDKAITRQMRRSSNIHHDRLMLPIWRPLEEDGINSGLRGEVKIGGQSDAVAHGNGNVHIEAVSVHFRNRPTQTGGAIKIGHESHAVAISSYGFTLL